MPAANELALQLQIVVDLAVEDDGDAVARHRLLPGGEIDDGEPLVIESDRPIDEAPLVVGAAMLQDRRHLRQHRKLYWTRLQVYDAYDAAHWRSPSSSRDDNGSGPGERRPSDPVARRARAWSRIGTRTNRSW